MSETFHHNLEGQRSHECERGTQECVRHNDFNILPGLTQNYLLAMLDPIRALHPAIQAQIDGHRSIGILNARRAQRRSLLFRNNLQR